MSKWNLCLVYVGFSGNYSEDIAIDDIDELEEEAADDDKKNGDE